MRATSLLECSGKHGNKRYATSIYRIPIFQRERVSCGSGAGCHRPKNPWGRQGDRRSSMLRNIARGHVWQFGVTGLPTVWPFMHFKLKSRVLFALPQGDEAGPPIADTKKQHRLRRSVCKGWRNKQWHGRLMAFLEMLSGDSSFIRLQSSEDAELLLEAQRRAFHIARKHRTAEPAD